MWPDSGVKLPQELASRAVGKPTDITAAQAIRVVLAAAELLILTVARVLLGVCSEAPRWRSGGLRVAGRAGHPEPAENSRGVGLDSPG